jgi:hypothetical protein
MVPLSEELLQELGAYLAERPFKEVAPFMYRIDKAVREAQEAAKAQANA